MHDTKANDVHNHGANSTIKKSDAAKSDANAALDVLFWRDEILQVIYWMHGEGLSEAVSAHDLIVFLDGALSTIQFHLDQAVADGFLHKSLVSTGGSATPQYTLTDLGRKEGGRRFRDEFAGMQKSGHGECSADCSCHTTGDHTHCPTHGHQH